MLDALEPEGIEDRQIAKTTPAAPLAGRMMRKLRALGLDIRWWAILWAAECAWAEIRRKPIPPLSTLAKRAKLPTRDLEHLGGRATLDEAAFLSVCVPPVFLKAHGFPVGPRVKKRAEAISKMLETAESKIGVNRHHLPWEEPTLKKVQEEQKR